MTDRCELCAGTGQAIAAPHVNTTGLVCPECGGSGASPYYEPRPWWDGAYWWIRRQIGAAPYGSPAIAMWWRRRRTRRALDAAGADTAHEEETT